MRNIVISMLLLMASQIAFAEKDSYECKFAGNPNWVSLKIDLNKKELVWGENELYDIKHNNNDYVSAYGRMGYTDHVGGAIMVLDRKNMELHYSQVALLVIDTDNSQKYVSTEHEIAKCRAK